MRVLGFFCLFLWSVVAMAQGVPRIDPSDPHRLLLGDDQLFLTGYYPGIQALIVHPQVIDFDNPVTNTYYVELVDALADRNVNLLRVVLTMGMALENHQWLHPYQRSGSCCVNDSSSPGDKFDVSEINPFFFDYWDAVISHAAVKDVIVQVALFDGFHSRVWDDTVGISQRPFEHRGRRYDYFRFENNINGHSLSNIAALYGGETGIKNRQIEFVQEAVERLGGHWNIIWEVSNEPQVTTPKPGVPAHSWLGDMRAAIRSAEIASNHPAHMIMPFDSPDHRDLGGHRTPDGSSTAINPAEYLGVHVDLVDDFNQFHLPLIADNDCCVTPGTPDQLRKKAWTSVVSGAYPSMLVYNVSGGPSPVGLNHSSVQQGMRYVGYTKKLMDERGVDLVGMVPSDNLLTTSDLVWCLARAGEEYILYFFDGGSVTVSDLPVSYDASWFDPRTGVFSPRLGSGSTFVAPPGGDQVLYIRASGALQETPGNLVADAFVAEGLGNSNFGFRPELRIRHAPSDQGKYSFLGFDVPQLNGTVTSAHLRLHTKNSQVSNVGVYNMSNMNWSESSINYLNWDNLGMVTFSFLDEGTSLAANSWHEFDVTPLVTGPGAISVGLASGENQTGFFWSSGSSLKPELHIEHSGANSPENVVAARDAWVSESNPVENYGNTLDLRVQFDPTHFGRYSFLRFEVPPYEGALESAILKLRTMANPIPSAGFYLMGNMGNWQEGAITWLNWDQLGTVTFSYLGDLENMAANTWHEIDVTAAIQGPSSVVSLGVASSVDTGGLNFWSKEAPAFAPELIITSRTTTSPSDPNSDRK
ncbi:MAG: DNRLRE domain-containing protein [Deltaproteobacteria bacterium]|nr:DNRLRE domain-containing protein [Deltaproteobacteria bacterium]